MGCQRHRDHTEKHQQQNTLSSTHTQNKTGFLDYIDPGPPTPKSACSWRTRSHGIKQLVVVRGSYQHHVWHVWSCRKWLHEQRFSLDCGFEPIRCHVAHGRPTDMCMVILKVEFSHTYFSRSQYACFCKKIRDYIRFGNTFSSPQLFKNDCEIVPLGTNQYLHT